MKKSTLLSLATAGAIVVTSAGTFAVWDTLTDTATGTVTFDKPVVTELTGATFTNEAYTLGSSTNPTAKATFPIKVDGVTDAVVQSHELVITAKIGNDSVMQDKKVSLVKGQSDYGQELTITAPDVANTGTEQTVTVTATLTEKQP